LEARDYAIILHEIHIVVPTKYTMKCGPTIHVTGKWGRVPSPALAKAKMKSLPIISSEDCTEGMNDTTQWRAEAILTEGWCKGP
jgi:hypothetical protein